jgi:hypothetical protein
LTKLALSANLLLDELQLYPQIRRTVEEMRRKFYGRADLPQSSMRSRAPFSEQPAEAPPSTPVAPQMTAPQPTETQPAPADIPPIADPGLPAEIEAKPEVQTPQIQQDPPPDASATPPTMAENPAAPAAPAHDPHDMFDPRNAPPHLPASPPPPGVDTVAPPTQPETDQTPPPEPPLSPPS